MKTSFCHPQTSSSHFMVQGTRLGQKACTSTIKKQAMGYMATLQQALSLQWYLPLSLLKCNCMQRMSRELCFGAALSNKKQNHTTMISPQNLQYVPETLILQMCTNVYV